MVALVTVALSSVASGTTPRAAETGSFELIGHNPLENRGMNAAMAVLGDYAYIGSRTDAKADNINHSGVMVVDISDPAAPEVVHEIGPPHEGNEGETSREMRIWPDKELLIVMNLGSNCASYLHGCSPRTVDDNFRFYDISGKNAAEPKLVAEYKPSINPHEFFLWDDPKKPGRALMFMSTPGGSASLLVTDISNANKGKFVELGTAAFGAEDRLHSISLSTDGRTAYLAHLKGGFMVADTSEFIDGVKKPEVRILTPPNEAPKWEGLGAHSSVKLPGRDVALVTDEVYGEALKALGHGCPWGWARFIDASNPVKPKVVSEYKLPQNDPSFCTTDVPRPSSSYSSHNPTLTSHLAFITWHAGGLQVVGLDNPKKPTQVAEYLPEPLTYVLQEDPALSAGQDKVVMWSFPVIKDGLIYVVDLRNGLYVLKYSGPYADEVASVDFLEGNSNLGDALRFEKP